MKRTLTSSCLVAALALGTSVFAEVSSGEGKAELPSSMPGVLGMVNSLMLVVLMILVLAWVFRRFVQPGQISSGRFRVLQVSNLGNRQKIVLFRAGDKDLLIGVSPNHMCLLSDEAASDDMPTGPISADSAIPEAGFAQLLKKFRSGNPGDAGKPGGSGS